MTAKQKRQLSRIKKCRKEYTGKMAIIFMSSGAFEAEDLKQNNIFF